MIYMNPDIMENTKRIHIVEDSNPVAERLVRMLSAFDSVEITGRSKDAEHAKSSIKETMPDVVLLDIFLESGNGLDVLIDIKKNNPPPLVIIFSNYCFPPFKQKCLSSGADYFFDKSNEFEKVLDVMSLISNN
jgi:two-component system response regulator DevR